MTCSCLRMLIVLCFAAVVALALGCGGGPAQGAEGGECYGNDTCNQGLECVAGVCVADPGDPELDAGIDEDTDSDEDAGSEQDADSEQDAEMDAGEEMVVSLEPALSFARVSDEPAPTFPEPLTLEIGQPSDEDQPVAIEVIGGDGLTVAEVVIPAGEVMVELLVTASVVGTYGIRASLGAETREAEVRVIAATAVPTGLTVEPDEVELAAGSSQTFTFTVDVPAPPGGLEGTIADTTGGLAPASVTIPEDQLSASFDYIAPDDPVEGTVTVSIVGTGVSVTAPVTVLPQATLIINEVDYINPGTDDREYVELYNVGPDELDLSDIVLLLINGANSESPVVYASISLAPAGGPAVIAPGGYLLVVPPTGVEVPAGVLRSEFNGQLNQLRDGPRDGIVLFDRGSGEVLDALAYRGRPTGSITFFDVEDEPIEFTFSETQTLPDDPMYNDRDSADGSVARIPNGLFTGAAADDFRFTTTLTPGTANPSSP